jgi:peptidoglycan hydrolase CwlO-like protein
MEIYMHCGRKFPTKEEKIEKLQEYKKWLENEIKGIEETIEEIKKAS